MALWGSQQDDEFFGDLEDDSRDGHPMPVDGRELESADVMDACMAIDRKATPTACDDGMIHRESTAVSDQFRNMGYLAAYDASKEVRLQRGFEDGFRQFVHVSSRVGVMLGEATARAQVVALEKRKHPAKDEEDRNKAKLVAAGLREFFDSFEFDDSSNETHDRLLRLESELRTSIKLDLSAADKDGIALHQARTTP